VLIDGRGEVTWPAPASPGAAIFTIDPFAPANQTPDPMPGTKLWLVSTSAVKATCREALIADSNAPRKTPPTLGTGVTPGRTSGETEPPDGRT
jgi:hypothetical protein